MTFPGAIIFDLDGTLIDSVPDVCASLNRVFAEEKLPLLDDDAVKALVGHGAMVLIEKALSSGGDDPARAKDLHPRFIDSYRTHPIDNTEIYPGVLETLETFRTAGIPMGICTNKPPATTAPVLKALNLGAYFEAVLCGDVAHKKPDARHVLDTLAILDAQEAGAVFVGDSETDAAAARNAGIPFIAVSYGYRNIPAEDLGADVLIDSFHQLADALDRLGREQGR